MPQLDLYSFDPQVCYFILVFLLAHFRIVYICVPKYAELLKLRLKLKLLYLKKNKKPIVLYDRYMNLILDSFKKK